MKKLFLVLVAMLLSVTPLMLTTSCNLLDLVDNCEAFKMDDENRTFLFSGQAQKDGKPWQGTLKIVMYKTYCDGTENGRKEFTANTDSYGKWKINWSQTYTYKNFDDFVTLEIYNESDGGGLVFTHNWNWQAVDTEHEYTYVNYYAMIFIN